MLRLKNQTIVITAGYGDIGRATCRRCCAEGARVFMTGRKPPAEGAAIAAAVERQARRAQARRLRALGVSRPQPSGSIEYLRCDSASRESINAMFAEVRRRAGRIDVAIGNAALVHNEPFLRLDPGRWQATLDLNLTGQFHFGQAAARIMVRQKAVKSPGCRRGLRGKILFNGSWVGEMPWAEGCSYAVAKAGLRTLVKAMANELAAQGVRVNLMAPGIVMAGLSKQCHATDPKFGPRAQSVIPLREFGTVEQCADAFLFLAGGESDYITGATLLVDGGASIPRRD